MAHSEAPKNPSQSGPELIETLIELTGLPKTAMEKEISAIMAQSGKSTDSLTLDDLRGALIEYLEQLSAEEERMILEAAEPPVSSLSVN